MSQTEQPTETIDLSELPDSGTPRRRRRHWLVVGLLVLVLAVAYGALVWWTGDRVANGTTVAGIDVGGQTETEARATLEEQLPAVAAAPVEVRVGGTEATLDPQDAGLGVDIADTVDRLTGYTANPATILARLTGGDEVRPTVTTDEGKATAALEDLDARVRIEPVEGAVAFAEGAVQVTDAADGAAVDVDAARGTLSERWPAPVAIDLPTVVLEPAIGSDAVAAAVDTIATPLLSAPVTVTADGHSAELSPEQVSAAATFLPVGEDGDTLDLALDGNLLRDQVTEQAPELRSDGQDARIVIQDGAPVVLPSQQGRGLDHVALAAGVREAVVVTEDRTVAMELTVSDPELTTEEAQALGVTEVIADFATNITNDRVRTSNLIVGSEKITNTLVLPGEEFSLLTELGPITRANGFGDSGVISSGFTAEALGGGLSQLSTNTYNAGFFGGMEDVTHKPHSRYYPRYPAGREATLWEGQVDMVWRNDTPYGVLVEAWVGGGQQHVRLWSTKYWQVEESRSGRYAITAPGERVNTAADCVPEAAGPSGFTIDIFRERWRDGSLVDEQSWTWTYQPWHKTVCR